MKKAALLAAVLAVLAAPARAIFDLEQMRYMTADPAADPAVATCSEGAATRMQYAYHMLKLDSGMEVCDAGKPRDQWCACMPPWLSEELPLMASKPAWRDPTEGTLSQAALWQGPFAVLFEFFGIVQKTFPPDQGGGLVPPGQLMREYARVRARYIMSLDRLYRARNMGETMGGRGRALLSQFDLINKEFDSVLDALVRDDRPQFATSTLAIAKLSHMAFKELRANPRGGKVEDRKPGPPILSMILTLAGMGLVFMAVWSLTAINSDKMGSALDQYMVRSKDWAQQFNRQFVTIKVHYLVIGPWAAFTLVGALTFNLPFMLICSGLGLFLGLRFPVMVLEQLRFKRGRQVEAQLIDALTLLGNALKSGMDLVGGFRLVQKELLPPISDEFGLVIKNFDLGTPFGKALEGLEERIDSRLLSYMVKAIVIQQQVGGNIIKIFDRIIENIREEAKLVEKTSALTAQQRIQSIVVGVMPWVMLGIMFLFQGQQMANFYTKPAGMILLIFCATWIGIGMKVVSAMGKVRV
jgi:tight adherence protein B